MNDMVLGVVKDGRVELEYPMPEGTRVEVRVFVPLQFTPEEQDEFDAWGRLCDRALATVEAMCDEDAPNAPR